MEGEELALRCTARSWCTLDMSQVRGTSATSGHVSLQSWGCASWQAVPLSVPGLLHAPEPPEVLPALCARGLLRVPFTSTPFLYFHPLK